MMSMEAIRYESEKAARKAARLRKEPYVIWDEREVERLTSFPFPVIGSYVPAGWQKVEELFCDASGFGSAGEPALTQQQLRGKLREYVRKPETYGFAITDVGQFQLYVGVFVKLPKRSAKAEQ